MLKEVIVEEKDLIKLSSNSNVPDKTFLSRSVSWVTLNVNVFSFFVYVALSRNSESPKLEYEAK